MAKLKLESDKFQESVGYMKKCFNQEILERVETIYRAIAGLEDDNQVVVQFIENSGKLQNSYNMCLESVDKFIKMMEDLFDISEYMKKASIEAVQSRDTSFEVSEIDTSAVIM
ncbi:hypothetical protein UT300012_23300 [Paraclostridium bifermentans]